MILMSASQSSDRSCLSEDDAFDRGEERATAALDVGKRVGCFGRMVAWLVVTYSTRREGLSLLVIMQGYLESG